MRLVRKLLAQSGTTAALFAVIMGTSLVHAANMDTADVRLQQDVTASHRPSPDSPLEERIKEAIEEIDQEGQAALEELGELDSSEKIDQAEQILGQMERATREIKKHAHDRTLERSQELNDIAVTRLHYDAQARLQELGELDSEEKRRKAEEVRAGCGNSRNGWPPDGSSCESDWSSAISSENCQNSLSGNPMAGHRPMR